MMSLGRARLFRWLLASVLVLALAATACSSGSTDPVASTEPTSPPAAASTEPVRDPATDGDEPGANEIAVDVDEPTVNETYVSPIGEALGVSQDEFAAALNTYVDDAEELVRQCMIEAGFEYAPIPSGIDRATQRQNELLATLTPDQFRDQYGFGIATLFELNFKGDGVLDFVNQQFGPPPTEERSPGEQQAYDLALNGETLQGLTAEEAQDQLFGGAVGASADGSCRSYGYATAENPGQAYDGLFSLLGDELDGLNDRFDNDPRIRQAMSEWQTCMASKGHAYERHFDIIEELQGATNDIAASFLGSPQVLEALDQAQAQGFTSMTGDERGAFMEEVGALQGFSWVPEVQAESDELVAFELLVAADSATCSDEDLFNAVSFELETQFVKEHGDQLALIAAGEN